MDDSQRKAGVDDKGERDDKNKASGHTRRKRMGEAHDKRSKGKRNRWLLEGGKKKSLKKEGEPESYEKSKIARQAGRLVRAKSFGQRKSQEAENEVSFERGEDRSVKKKMRRIPR